MKFQIANFRWPAGQAKRAAAVSIRNPQSAIRNFLAFTLIEILIVVALLSVIILGLLAMFGQTQRVFRLGMTQTDVLESGRLATDLIVRELEQVTPYLPGSNRVPYYYLNFYAFQPDYAPLVQALPGSTFPRTNLLYDFFFITRRNQEWIGIGYGVRKHNPANANNPNTPDLDWPVVQGNTPVLGAGALYRFETNAPDLSGRTPAHMYNEFYKAMQKKSRVSEIMDGVVHFCVRAYNTNGYWITSDRDVSASGNQTNSMIVWSTVTPGEVGQYLFYDNAVPSSVELELGILEDRAWGRYKALPDDASQYRYLVNQVGRVHLFRQRVTIRSVDPIAYR